MASVTGTRGTRVAVVLMAASVMLVWSASESRAQGGQFGAQARADAASQMIVLGVQQGISSLPPTSGQSLTYQFDPELSTFVASEQLGPTAFRSPQTVGKDKWALRASYSFFELEDKFGPIDYLVEFNGVPVDPNGQPIDGRLVALSAFGQKVKATVNLLNLGLNYGILDRLEFMFNVPISVVDAHASQISAVQESSVNVPLADAQAGAVGGIFPPGPLTDQDINDLESAFDEVSSPSCNSEVLGGECIRFRTDPYQQFPGLDFNNGTSAGVGRISLGVKYLFLAHDYINMAGSFEFFNPSPSQDEFAGSDSAAILPRVIMELPGRFREDDYFRLHADLGYDYDFDSSELRRIVWNTGASVPFGRWVTIDFGVGGSEFEEGIRWTPKVSGGSFDAGVNPFFPDGGTTTLVALGDTRLGTSFVDFLGGIKVRLTDTLVLSGSATTPLNNQGFRAAAVGTIAIEGYL